MKTWTDADFEKMSWHDNHVHGLQVRAGEHGSGDLLLDLDYIQEWLCEENGRCRFSIVPATLHFREVVDLKIEVDWAARTAALCPFSLAQITRSPKAIGPGYSWELTVNWPAGGISFGATGFTQRQTGQAVVSDEQVLAPHQRP